jgi:hypothetical protein
MAGEAYAWSVSGDDPDVPEWLCRAGYTRLVLIIDPKYTDGELRPFLTKELQEG